jgi:hypothetical protein
MLHSYEAPMQLIHIKETAIHPKPLKPMLKILPVLFLAMANLARAQDYLWPVKPRMAPPIVQGFGEFGDVSKAKYHTGIDIGVPLGTAVFPVADGEVVQIQLLSATADKGFGRSVVMRHDETGQKIVYSQYSHLSEIDPALIDACKPTHTAGEVTLTCVSGVQRTTEDNIGRSGGSGFGIEDKWLPHLHLELKTFGKLCTSDDAGIVCGYSTAKPWTIGYLDPIEESSSARSFPKPVPVRVTTNGVSVRFTPDAEQSQRPITTIDGTDTTVLLLGIAWSGGGAPCEMEGWIQVRRADEPNCATASGASTCFPDTLDPKKVGKYLGLIPTAWICAKYLSPLKVPTAREAVTEGILFSGGSVEVKRVGTQGLSIESIDRDGLFAVYEASQLGSGAITDMWNLVFLDMVYEAPPYKAFADNNRDLTTALLARYGTSCAGAQTPNAQSTCAVSNLANSRGIRMGGGRYDEGQRCVGWRNGPDEGTSECRPE